MPTFSEKFNERFRAPKPFDDGLIAVKADIILDFIAFQVQACLEELKKEKEIAAELSARHDIAATEVAKEGFWSAIDVAQAIVKKHLT